MKKLRIFAIILLSFIVLTATGCGGSSTTSETDWENFCEYQAKEMVKNRLKAPSTAKFSSVTVISASSEGCEVTGYVDAENSFGANIRSYFRAEAGSDGVWDVSIS